MPAGLDGNPNPLVTPERTAVLQAVTQRVLGAKVATKPLLVAIDGISGAGKSTFADELARALSGYVNVVRSTTDSFHNPRRTRLARGKTSPVGFYLDSHNLAELRKVLLDPFVAGDGSRYVPAIFDEPSDAPVVQEPATVRSDDVLLFDGIFVQRPELVDYWDLTIFLDAQTRVDLHRLGYVLDELPTAPIDVVGHVLEWQRRIDRYASGTRYYVDLVDPAVAADILIDNNDLANPLLLR